MIFNSFIYTLKREVRDKTSLLLMILFPIILVLVVGTSLKKDFEAPSFNKAKIAIVDLDGGKYSDSLKEIYNSDTLKDFVAVRREIKTLDKAKEEYYKKEIDAIIEIPKGFGEKSSNEIIITEPNKNSQELSIVRQIADDFVGRLNIYNMDGVNRDNIEEINDVFKEEIIKGGGVSDKHIPNSMDYYGVTLIILVCLYGSLYNVKMYSDTLLDEVGIRISTITLKRYKIQIGISLASLLLVFIQIMILFLVFKFGYNVYYGDNLSSIFALLGSLILFSNAMGLFLIKLFKNYNVTYTVSNILILGMTFLASGFVILDLGNGVLGNIVENYLPNAVCQNAIFSLIYETNSVTVIRAITVILAQTVILLGLPTLFKRKGGAL